MNLDELQSVQARERQSSDLQHLRSSFYSEVGEYIDELTDRRAALVEEADDPFSAPDVRQLSDDIETAEQTVEAIYERRVGKVVKKASIAAAGMPVDDDGLTVEEEALFEALVDRIERNRETVLSVLDGEAPAVQDDDAGPDGEAPAVQDDDAGPDTSPGGGVDDGSGPDPVGTATVDTGDAGGTRPGYPDDAESGGDEGEEPEGVDAAELMGAGEGGAGDDPADPGDTPASGAPPESDGADGDASRPADPPGEATPGDPEADRASGDPGDRGGEEGRPDGESGRVDDATGEGEDDATVDPDAEPDRARGSTAGSGDPAAGGDGAATGTRDVPSVPRTTVRITAEVGEVVGADNRDYDLGPEDVVTLPEPNADVLVAKDAAERLE